MTPKRRSFGIGGSDFTPKRRRSSSQQDCQYWVPIHQKVLAFLDSSSENDIPRRRLFLASEIARARSRSELATRDLTVGRSKSKSGDPEEKGEKAPVCLALSLQQERRKQKLVASYRLGGITAAVPKIDPEILSLRLDICLDGTYVACYHAFLDFIVATAATPAKETQLYLRFAQHTIPSAIPILELCRSTLGGSLLLMGDPNDREGWQHNVFLERIRSLNRHCYRACWCWERRKQAWNCLQKQQEKNTECVCSPTSTCEGHLWLDSLSTTCSNSYGKILFNLSKMFCPADGSEVDGSSIAAWQVGLIYEDFVHGLPTTVHVAQLEDPKHQSSRLQEHDEHSIGIQKAFLDHPADQALPIVAELWK